jgi:hypothetical protein
MKLTMEGLTRIAGPAATVLLATGVLEPLWGWWGVATLAQLLLATIFSFIAAKRSRWWLLLSGLCVASLAGLIAAVAI